MPIKNLKTSSIGGSFLIVLRPNNKHQVLRKNYGIVNLMLINIEVFVYYLKEID
jgi:hypothetical protein